MLHVVQAVADVAHRLHHLAVQEGALGLVRQGYDVVRRHFLALGHRHQQHGLLVQRCVCRRVEADVVTEEGVEPLSHRIAGVAHLIDHRAHA